MAVQAAEQAEDRTHATPSSVGAVPHRTRSNHRRRTSSWGHIRTLRHARREPERVAQSSGWTDLVSDSALSIGSLSASLWLTRLVEPLGLLAYGVLVPHELSHLATATVLGVEAKPPLFIPVLPLVIGCVGITRVRRCDLPRRRAIAIAGPITGMLVATSLMAGAALLASPLMFWLSTIFFLEEGMHLIMGHDRKVLDAEYAPEPMDDIH